MLNAEPKVRNPAIKPLADREKVHVAAEWMYSALRQQFSKREEAARRAGMADAIYELSEPVPK